MATVLVARVSTSDQTLVLPPSTAYWRLLALGAGCTLGGFDFLLPRRRNASAGGMASGSGALAYLEERHAALGSAYEDLHWPLSAVIKWIAGRTPEAVDRLSIDEDAAEEAVVQLQAALERGEIAATASTTVDPIPRPLPPNTWGRYQVCIEDDGNLLWPRVLHDTTEREDLLNVQLSRADVIRNWPSAKAPETVPPSTSGKEAACRAWLAQIMRDEPDKPRAKEEVWTEALRRFPSWPSELSTAHGHGPSRTRRPPGGARLAGAPF